MSLQPVTNVSGITVLEVVRLDLHELDRVVGRLDVRLDVVDLRGASVFVRDIMTTASRRRGVAKTPSPRPRGRVDGVEATWFHEDAIAATASSSSSYATPRRGPRASRPRRSSFHLKSFDSGSLSPSTRRKAERRARISGVWQTPTASMTSSRSGSDGRRSKTASACVGGWFDGMRLPASSSSVQ